MCLLFGLAIPPLKVYPLDVTAQIQNDICTKVIHHYSLLTAQDWKQHKGMISMKYCAFIK